MARTRKTSREALDEKIKRAEADVIAAKKRYDHAFGDNVLFVNFNYTDASLLEPEQPTLRSGFPHSVGERHLSRGGQIRSKHNQQEYEEVQGTVP